VRYERKRRTKQSSAKKNNNDDKHNNNNNNNRDIKIDRGWEVTENGSHMQDTNRKAAGIYKTYI